ncbi:MAG: NADH-quinone oxidoreductase subunit J [Bacteroidota bacterium]|nr:NADH-quinone oxidoreductase subunit J [Bacteroidota bacterium]
MEISIYITYLVVFLIFVSGISLCLVKNLMHAALLFLCILLCLAMLYIINNAEFAAISHILIYIGGVLIIILFGIMLSRMDDILLKDKHILLNITLLSTSIIIFVLISITLFKIRFDEMFLHFQLSSVSAPTTNSNVKSLAFVMLTEYIVPFEVSGILLLFALIGAAFISQNYRHKIL